MPMRKVGFFHSGRKASFDEHYKAFLRGLHDLVPAKDIDIVVQWAGDNPERGTLRVQARDVLDKNSDIKVLVAAGGPPSSKATKEATQDKGVPVVFMSTADPVGLGLVESLDRPGTNMTGIAGLTSELDVSRLELLRELLQDREIARIGVLNNGNRPLLEEQYQKLEAAAPELDVQLVRSGCRQSGGDRAGLCSFQDCPRGCSAGDGRTRCSTTSGKMS